IRNALRAEISTTHIRLKVLLQRGQTHAIRILDGLCRIVAAAYELKEPPELFLPVAISEHEIVDQCPRFTVKSPVLVLLVVMWRAKGDGKQGLQRQEVGFLQELKIR